MPILMSTMSQARKSDRATNGFISSGVRMSERRTAASTLLSTFAASSVLSIFVRLSGAVGGATFVMARSEKIYNVNMRYRANYVIFDHD